MVSLPLLLRQRMMVYRPFSDRKTTWAAGNSYLAQSTVRNSRVNLLHRVMPIDLEGDSRIYESLTSSAMSSLP